MAYRILVAEDDGDIVQVLKLYLNNEGYEVLHAPNGAEALEIMEQQPADLCIFDIMMPRMDGYELIRRVREFSAVPITSSIRSRILRFRPMPEKEKTVNRFGPKMTFGSKTCGWTETLESCTWMRKSCPPHRRSSEFWSS